MTATRLVPAWVLAAAAALLAQEPPAPAGQDSEPKPEQAQEKPPIASEGLKTLIDKVRDKVVRMDQALQTSSGTLLDFEAEITGKTLGEIDFKALADSVGGARSTILDVLKDADLLVSRLDKEVIESMAEEEKLLFRDGTSELDPAKASRLTRTIRTVLEVHEALPGDSLAKMSLETLAQAIDSYVSPEALGDFLDITSISSDIVRSLMRYRDSIHKSLQTLQHLQDILSVLENKSRDLNNLLSREGDAPDRASMTRVQGLIRDILDNRDKALTIFRKIGRKVRDLRRADEGAAAETRDQMDRLRDRYLGGDSGER